MRTAQDKQLHASRHNCRAEAEWGRRGFELVQGYIGSLGNTSHSPGTACSATGRRYINPLPALMFHPSPFSPGPRAGCRQDQHGKLNCIKIEKSNHAANCLHTCSAQEPSSRDSISELQQPCFVPTIISLLNEALRLGDMP
eukprot:TRINITY_DN64028_c0_g1_i1.p1 TRINITY_DN64028_c0_g1~~TRINITY_DN64028_c0_g1_i1.p1  ORF type:complete len:141 (+),score=7.08 TRINITY_DN64028_c0_g1_i1:66-488(+)